MIHQRQLFHAAVARMASSPAPLHDRILQAYEAFKSVRADDFMSEPNIRDAYTALLVMLRGACASRRPEAIFQSSYAA